MESDLFEPEHEQFRTQVRDFVADEVVPNLQRWNEQRGIDRETWLAAAAAGILGLPVPVEYGGRMPAAVTDYRYRTVVVEEVARVGAASLQSGLSTNDDIVLRYLLRLGTDEQKRCWVPRFTDGTTIASIAMTEPEAGSDIRATTFAARPHGNDHVLTGTKSFITSGMLANLVLVLARDEDGRHSLYIVEGDAAGLERVRQLDKVGLAAQDTADLRFDDVRVPAANRLGEPGRAMAYLRANLAVERLAIALAAQFSAEAVFSWTLKHTSGRTAFGHRIADFQGIGFTLAELSTEIDVSRAYVDRCIRAFSAGQLSEVDAAKAKLWTTEMQWRVIDAGVQLHGGRGYLRESPVAQAFLDARVQRIYGGTSEIMKEIIRRNLVRNA